jgi:hypothetical protein
MTAQEGAGARVLEVETRNARVYEGEQWVGACRGAAGLPAAQVEGARRMNPGPGE